MRQLGAARRRGELPGVACHRQHPVGADDEDEFHCLVRAELVDKALPCRRAGPAVGKQLVGRLEDQPVHTVKVVVAPSEAGDVFFGQPTGGGDPDVLAPKERRAPSVSKPQDRQLTQAQRQLTALQQKSVVTKKTWAISGWRASTPRMSKFSGSLGCPEPARGTSSPGMPNSAPTAAYSSSPHSSAVSGRRRVMFPALPDHAVRRARGSARGSARASDG